MYTQKAVLFHRKELILGESPVWHAGWQCLLYVDIEGMLLGWIYPDTGISGELQLAARLGAVIPMTDGRLLLAMQGRIVSIDFPAAPHAIAGTAAPHAIAGTATAHAIAGTAAAHAALRPLIELEKDQPDNRCNDGKCDPAGRLWIGTMHTAVLPGRGALYCYDGNLCKKIAGTTISNGMCWSPDGGTFYYIDSCHAYILAFDYDLSTGVITNGHIVVSISTPGHVPDGMTIDKEGMLWVAIWGGGCVDRYDPFSGALIGRIMVEAPNVTSCVFGGKDMDILWITTAREGLTSRQLNDFPLSGSLFECRPGVAGLPAHYFNPGETPPSKQI